MSVRTDSSTRTSDDIAGPRSRAWDSGKSELAYVSGSATNE